MEPKGSLLHSQVRATCPYPEPAESSPYPLSHFLKFQLNIILPSTLGSPKCFFPSGFPTKTLYTPLLSPYALRARPISFLSILLPAKYWVSVTDH